jgi:hypothetical protein
VCEKNNTHKVHRPCQVKSTVIGPYLEAASTLPTEIFFLSLKLFFVSSLF